jgi:hypothetical protein
MEFDRRMKEKIKLGEKMRKMEKAAGEIMTDLRNESV